MGKESFSLYKSEFELESRLEEINKVYNTLLSER